MWKLRESQKKKKKKKSRVWTETSILSKSLKTRRDGEGNGRENDPFNSIDNKCLHLTCSRVCMPDAWHVARPVFVQARMANREAHGSPPVFSRARIPYCIFVRCTSWRVRTHRAFSKGGECLNSVRHISFATEAPRPSREPITSEGWQGYRD